MQQHLETRGYTLRNYQVAGVSWMFRHESDGHGGILADEPGLGKTLQALALSFLTSLHPTLIVVPKSVINQWHELAQSIFGKDAVYVFQGRNKEENLDKYRIVITTYTTLILNGGTPDAALLWVNYIKSVENLSQAATAEKYKEWSSLPKQLRRIWEKEAKRSVSPLRKTTWTRVILDEAHRIKNKKTNGYKACCALKTSYRWALTGTPIQNRVKELKTLFSFVNPELEISGRSDLQPLIDVYLLRRKKSDYLQELPQLLEEIIEVPFATKEEQDIYTRIEQQVFDQISLLQEQGTHSNGQNLTLLVLEHILRLRQAAQHPALFIDAMGRKMKSTTKSTLPNTSSKHNRLLSLVQDTPNKPSLVFFQFTAEMTMLKSLFESNGINVFQLNGTMNLTERNNQIRLAKEAAIQHAQGGPPCSFFIQIVAGGVGLNLQEFSQVYILSPDWNPFNEVQAIGRSYRSGQTSSVLVRRLVLTYPPDKTKHTPPNQTIDQRIQAMQDKKLAMASTILNDPSIHSKTFQKNKERLIQSIIGVH